MVKIESVEEFKSKYYEKTLTEPTILFFTSSRNTPIDGNNSMTKLMHRVCKEYPEINMYHLHDIKDIKELYSIDHWPSLDFFKDGILFYFIKGVISHMELSTRIRVMFEEVISDESGTTKRVFDEV